MKTLLPSTHRILVCDDDEGIADISRIILEGQGYQVEVCADGGAVCQRAVVYQPDLIILDLWMPNLGGEQVLGQLKKHPATSQIPVIVVSANKDTRQIAQRAAASDFLCKPYNIAALEEVVRKHLPRRR